ncbi:hypothetical protein [Caldivirga sp.]|jgi:hypothetical protein
MNWTYPIHYGYIAVVKGNYTGYEILYRMGLISGRTYEYVMEYNET